MLRKYLQYIKEIRYLTGEDVKKLPIIVLIFLASSFLDLLGIGLIIPYITVIISPEKIGTLGIFSMLGLSGSTDVNKFIVMMSIGLILVFLIKAFVSYNINKMILHFSYNKAVKLRGNLLSYYQSMPYEEYLKRNSSEYIYTIVTLTAIFAQGILQAVLRLFSEGIVIIAIFIVLLFEGGIELLFLASIIGLIIFGYDIIFRRRLIQYGRTVDVESKKLVQGIQETIDGLRELRILSKESFFYNKIMATAMNLSKASVASASISSLPRYLVEQVIILFIVSMVLLTMYFERDMVGLASTLGMFGVAAMRIVPSVNQVVASLVQLSHNRNAVSLLYQDTQKISGSLDSAIPKYEKQTLEIFQSIALKNINFTYSGSQSKVLNDLSLEVSKGESIGIIGVSGAGKSTLIDLLLGLLIPQSGGLYLNGRILESEEFINLQNKIAYLPQQIFLIDDTLKRNVALGVEDNQIDESKVLLALEKSNLLDLVSKLPQGLETKLGERGVRLSGGQRQRVAIARTFYFERDIIVMDEATSALDSETESEIVDEIKRLKGQKTLIIIAHRLSTLKYCDRIYRLESGKIVAQGDFNNYSVNIE